LKAQRMMQLRLRWIILKSQRLGISSERQLWGLRRDCRRIWIIRRIDGLADSLDGSHPRNLAPRRVRAINLKSATDFFLFSVIVALPNNKMANNVRAIFAARGVAKYAK